ncbi:SpoIID/LytB domain-containing protein [Pelosinus sp. sgz500959]|uniref:SpoIID/LytB domain-containing protein n=1 Tax=Pelosinus sp. sgz500959 TaxID=3242472 RepID=UPI00366A794A
MKRAFSHIFLLVVLFTILFTIPVYAQAPQSMIRVGILSNQQNVSISVDSDFEVLDGDTGQVVAHFSAKENVNIAVKGKKLTINGQQIPGDTIKFLKLKNGRENDMKINQKKYRGNIAIHMTHGKTGLTVINTLSIEQYLYGVIAREMSPSWPMEAVKAQTVAARSYAMYNLNKHQDDGYDVCATTDCQVYGGRESEVPQIIKAVDDTAGQVITYQGKIIPGYFHSSSGGYTENSENVWSGYQPYLRGVVDYDQKSPQYKWEQTITVPQLEKFLAGAGYQIGVLKAIELAPLTHSAVDTPERGVSGRVKVIRFIGSTGSAKLTGEQLRKMLDLKSTLFDVSVVVPIPPVADFEITKNIGESDRKKLEINLPAQREQSFLTGKKELHAMTGRVGESILISGFGWGHGLGLSQWGAKAMAEQGPQGNTTYFKEILKHYYKGTTIKKVF